MKRRPRRSAPFARSRSSKTPRTSSNRIKTRRHIFSQENMGPSSSTKGTSAGWPRNTPKKPGFPPSRSTSSAIAAPQTSFGRTSPFALWLSGSGTPKARSWTTTPICSRMKPTRSAASSTAIRSSIAEGGKACHRSPSPSGLLPWARLVRSRAENRSRKTRPPTTDAF